MGSFRWFKVIMSTHDEVRDVCKLLELVVKNRLINCHALLYLVKNVHYCVSSTHFVNSAFLNQYKDNFYLSKQSFAF